MIIGYARVSTPEQKLDLQLDRLKEAGCEKIYSEQVSGRTGKQTELDKLLENIRPGDTLMVYSLCRLGRTTNKLLDLIAFFKEKDIRFKSLTEGFFDTTTPMGEALLQIISVLKAMEVNVLRERSAHGLAAARARGITGGRPKGLSPKSIDKAEAVAELYKSNKPLSFIQKTLNVSRSQIYRFLKFQNIPLRSDIQ